MTQIDELKALLLELTKELHETRADIAWLKQQWQEPQFSCSTRAVVTLSDSFEFGEPTLSLTAEEWTIVKRGDKFEKFGDGLFNDGKFYCWDYWEFEGGIGGKINFSVKFKVEQDFELEIEEILFTESKRSTNPRLSTAI